MIHSQDRKGWFGASDTYNVMSDNHNTKKWIGFWDSKLGAPNNGFSNKYTRAGTLFEPYILDAIDDEITKDGQIIIEDFLIRVNYDGYKDGVIYEVKTHTAKNDFKVTKEYWQQCQVEMYAYKAMAEKYFLPPFKKLYIVSYPMYDEDYETREPEVDPNRIRKEEIEYDEKFIKKYLRRVKRLSKKLRKALEEQGEAENEAYKHEEGESTTDTQ